MVKCHPPEPPSAETADASLVLGQHHPEATALPLISDGSDRELPRGRALGERLGFGVSPASASEFCRVLTGTFWPSCLTF